MECTRLVLNWTYMWLRPSNNISYGFSYCAKIVVWSRQVLIPNVTNNVNNNCDIFISNPPTTCVLSVVTKFPFAMALFSCLSDIKKTCFWSYHSKKLNTIISEHMTNLCKKNKAKKHTDIARLWSVVVLFGRTYYRSHFDH